MALSEFVTMKQPLDPNYEDELNESLSVGDVSVGELIRRQMREQRAARFWFLVATTAILATISVVGTVGNALTVAVFGWRLVRSTPNVLICVLGGVDLVIDLLVIPAAAVDVWEAELHNEASCRASHLLRIAVVMFETFVLILIALDRYLRICFIPPVRLRRLHLRLILAFFALLALLLGVPPALSVSIHVTTILLDGGGAAADEQLLMKSCTRNQEILSAELLSYYWIAIAILFIATILVTCFFYVSIFLVVYLRSSVFRSAVSLQNSMNAVTYTTTVAAAPSDINELQKRLRSRITPLTLEDTNKPQLRDSEATTPTPSEANANTLHVTPPEEPFSCAPKAAQLPALVITHQQNNSLAVAAAASRSLGSRKGSPCGEHSANGFDSADATPNAEVHINRSISTASKMSALVTPSRAVGAAAFGPHALHRPNRRGGGAQRRPHLKPVLVTVLVTLSFAVSYTPLILIHSQIIKFEDRSGSTGSSSALRVLYYLYFLQNALNPITYAVVNPAFRSALWGLFASWCSRPAAKKQVPRSSTGPTFVAHEQLSP